MQIADCPDDQVQITVYKKGIAFGVGRPEDWWHVETVGDTICYETTYIDANFLTQNYTLGECPDQFTVDLSSTDEVICNGRSSENVRTADVQALHRAGDNSLHVFLRHHVAPEN